jgi:hypothetical protein
MILSLLFAFTKVSLADILSCSTKGSFNYTEFLINLVYESDYSKLESVYITKYDKERFISAKTYALTPISLPSNSKIDGLYAVQINNTLGRSLGLLLRYYDRQDDSGVTHRIHVVDFEIYNVLGNVIESGSDIFCNEALKTN